MMDTQALERFPDLMGDRATIRELLSEHETPLFLGSKAVLEDRFHRLTRCLRETWPRYTVAYSFKTNYLVAKAKILQQLGAWAEVVSGWEYEMAKELGYPGDRIVFNGPYRTGEQLRQALEDGAVVNINDSEQLTALMRACEERELRRRIGIRVSSGRVGLGPSRFGFSLDTDEAVSAVRAIRESPWLELSGLHMHLRGDTDDPEIYRAAARLVGSFLKENVAGYRESIRHVDMGGGFPASGPKPRSRKSWNPREIEEYVGAITAELEPFFAGSRKPTLMLEPGRYLVGDAIVLVTRVVRARRSAGESRLTCSGSISMVPLMHYCPQWVQVLTPELVPRQGIVGPTVVDGASCREDDVVFEGSLPEAEVGDYLVHYAVGAYNSSLGPDFIFPSPPAVFY